MTATVCGLFVSHLIVFLSQHKHSRNNSSLHGFRSFTVKDAVYYLVSDCWSDENKSASQNQKFFKLGPEYHQILHFNLIDFKNLVQVSLELSHLL